MNNDHIYRPQELIVSLLPGLQIAHQAIGREIEQIKALLGGSIEPPSIKLKSKPQTDHMDVGEEDVYPANKKKRRYTKALPRGGNTNFIVGQLRENGTMSPTQLADIAAKGNVGNLGHKANIGNALKRAIKSGHVVRVADGVYALSEREKMKLGLYPQAERVEPMELGLPTETPDNDRFEVLDIKPGDADGHKQPTRVFTETQKGWLLSLMQNGLTLNLEALKHFAAVGAMGKLGHGNNMSVLLNHGVKDGLIKKLGGGNYAITTAGKKFYKEKLKFKG